jgi:hypothetical protein
VEKTKQPAINVVYHISKTATAAMARNFSCRFRFIYMNAPDNILENTKSLISVLELRRLLVDVKEKRPDICVRYRLLGEMWVVNSMRVLRVTEKGVMLNDEHSNKLISLPDLSSIMQFEIDAPFQGFQPHFHYNVRPMSDFKE